MRDEVARCRGLPVGCLAASGAGDNAAGAVGIGCIHLAEAFVSLGSSSMVFVGGDRFLPHPGWAVHAFRHGLPAIRRRLAVILSAADSLTWLA